MYATNYLETKFLNVLRGQPFSAPSTCYIGLFMTSPTDDGSKGIEANYAGYERVAIAFDEPEKMNNGIGVKNTDNATFAQSLSDSGTVTHIGICDEQHGGNMIAYGELTEPLPIKANEAPTMIKGEIIFYLNGNLSEAYKIKLLNIFRGITIPAANTTIALFSGSPDMVGNEFIADNYERESVSFSPPVENSSNRMMVQNTSNIAFNVPTTNWGVLSNFGIMDAETDGSAIFIGTISPSKEIKKGHNVQILATNLKCSID